MRLPECADVSFALRVLVFRGVSLVQHLTAEQAGYDNQGLEPCSSRPHASPQLQIETLFCHFAPSGLKRMRAV